MTKPITITTPPLRLEGGKFYRGDEEVKPEFGNWEMIRLMREAEEMREARKKRKKKEESDD
jgi:hypothetical protein